MVHSVFAVMVCSLLIFSHPLKLIRMHFTADTRDAAKCMPHPLREISQGRPVYSIPLIIFIDDVSGNVSKQWNKHYSCYVSNGALPRELQELEANVRFVSTSTNASPLEMMKGIRTSLE